MDGTYWGEHGLPRPDTPTKLVERAGRMTRRPTLKRWQTVRDAIRGLPAPRGDRTELVTDYGVTRAHVMDEPVWTLTATHWNNKWLETGGGGRRYLTVREMARLQGFDDS